MIFHKKDTEIVAKKREEEYGYSNYSFLEHFTQGGHDASTKMIFHRGVSQKSAKKLEEDCGSFNYASTY